MTNKKAINWIAIMDWILLVLIGTIIGASIMLWRQDVTVSKLVQEHESMYSKFSAIDYLLESEFYDQNALSGAYDKMIDWALVWYVDALDDPYTTYLTKENNTDLLNELEENAWFAGIWAVIEKKDDYALISEVIKRSPAAKAWLLPLDRIYMVDNQTIQDLDVNEVVSLIRWEKWTEVNLLIRRPEKNNSEHTQFSIPIVRDDVNVPSVTSELIQKNGKNLLYLEVSIIASHTTSLLLEEVRDAIDEVHQIDWIILDLRWNSWWYLEEAVKLLWHFFEKWHVVVKSKYMAYEDIDHLSEWRWELWNYPIVVIVDQLTASAGEIIALALQEKWTPLIWMQTFGKWSIQSVEDFADGSSLKYTVWKRYSPNNISIDKEWVTPDIEISRDYEVYQKDGTDNQLEKAKEELLKIIK